MESSNEEEFNFEEFKGIIDEFDPYNDKGDLRNLDIYPGTQPTRNETLQNGTGKSFSRQLSSTEKALFEQFKYKNNKQVRKEFMRTQVIRGYKRAIRECLANKIPKTKLGEVITKNQTSKNAWDTFKRFIMSDRNFFEILGKTEEGPDTEGKSKRTGRSKSKSFNNEFCREFFSHPDTIRGYNLFIDLVFAIMDCKSLQIKFGFAPTKHSPKQCSYCIPSWTSLKSYLTGEMIQSLSERTTESQLPLP